MDVEFGNVAQWIALAISLITVAWGAITVRTKAAADKVDLLEKAMADKASTGRMAAAEDRLARMDSRLTALENELRHLPSRDQTHKLEIAIAQMSGQLNVMSERLSPVAAISERLQEYLLEEAKGRRGGQ